jgi:hypothetical protein
MKKHAMNLLIIAAVFLTWGCSTSNDAKPANATYKFTVNGTTYTEVAGKDSTLTGGTGALSSANTLSINGQSADKASTVGLVFFWKGTAKPKAGSYQVIGDATTINSNQVGILVVEKPNSVKEGIYSTTGLDGSSITVSVSGSGKLSVTMPSVAIKGTLLDNTDPKNTVSTSVSTTMSGPIAEL